MKFNLALLFLVGFIAFAVAAPVEEDDDNAELETPEQRDVESDSEEEDNNEEPQEEQDPEEEEPDTEVGNTEQDPADENVEKDNDEEPQEEQEPEEEEPDSESVQKTNSDVPISKYCPKVIIKAWFGGHLGWHFGGHLGFPKKINTNTNLEDSVIEQKEVVQLASLRILYIQELERNGFPNPEYRSEKLRARLENHDIRELIDFAKVNPADELEVNSTDEILPPDLVRFLNYVVSGDENERKCEKTRRIVLSIGQDICRAVTNGEWKMPKHILLCTTLRHLYRSKQLTTILSRLGHCETYDFGLELETALAKALDEVSTSLTPQIITGEGNNVFHFEWDNMNKITTNIHGSNVVNSAGGIMIQEVKPGFDAKNDRTLPLYKRSTTRALKVDTPETLAPVHIYSRVGPKLPERAMFTMPTVNSEVYLKSVKEYQVWMLARVVGSSGVKQLVPGFGGFVSATGTKPVRKSTIEYFTPINQPFTEYSVIKELLKRSENATREVGQEYVLNTFDLGGCMKALPLIWKFPDEYKKHVVLPGPFHTGMNYMGMVTGNKCRGSGYSEILIEAGLVTSGCLTSVLKGNEGIR
ncbi:hypothetical protein QZH41_020323 [Actinostola sp. cb2023]|nr:hypothetical protein QZH41_020323 [Actinostola sp. cb2023]